MKKRKFILNRIFVNTGLLAILILLSDVIINNTALAQEAATELKMKHIMIENLSLESNHEKSILVTFWLIDAHEKQTGIQELIGWIQNGDLSITGADIRSEQAEIMSPRKVRFPVEIRDPSGNEYDLRYVHLKIEDQGVVETPVSLYNGRDHLVKINFMGRQKATIQKNNNKVYEYNRVSKMVENRNDNFSPIVFTKLESEGEEKRKAFIARYKYWMIGTVAVLGSATAILSNSDAAVYLPEPPGRP